MPVTTRGRQGLSFFGMVGAVMAILKLKENWDQYKSVPEDEDEGRVALHSPPAYRDRPDGAEDPESGLPLLDTEIPMARPTKRKRSGCCVCCGIDCGLFWKAVGIVLALFTLYGAFKLVFWAFTPSPTGLENMPAFSSSLGCLDAPHIYNGSQVAVTVPLGSTKQDHGFDLHGSAVGTIIVAEGKSDATEIVYEMTLRTNDESLLDGFSFRYPDIEEDGTVTRSQFIVDTPQTSSDKSCVRYDITMRVPPNLKKLHVASHSPAHVMFDSESKIKMDDMFVTLYATDEKNMILPNENVQAKKLALEVFRGWIVGDASVVVETAITTQRGDGVANVRVHPTMPADAANPKAATFSTTTGAGRSDFFYVANKAFKRPIDSTHYSSKNGDVYLTYKDAEFNGKIALDSKSFTGRGTARIPAEPGSTSQWTHYAGDMEGGDAIRVSSRGWTGLYF